MVGEAEKGELSRLFPDHAGMTGDLKFYSQGSQSRGIQKYSNNSSTIFHQKFNSVTTAFQQYSPNLSTEGGPAAQAPMIGAVFQFSITLKEEKEEMEEVREGAVLGIWSSFR